MTGGVVADRILARYWQALSEEARAQIREAIPEGYHIRIYAGHRAQPGTGTVSLRTADNRAIAEVRTRDLAGGCWAVLRAPALRVTTDVNGYVTDIEDVT